MRLATLILCVVSCSAPGDVRAMRPAPFDERYEFENSAGARLISTNAEGGGHSTVGVTRVLGSGGELLYEIPVFTGRRGVDLSEGGSVAVLDGDVHFGDSAMRAPAEDGDEVVTSVYLGGSLWKEVLYNADLGGGPIDQRRIMGGEWARRTFTMDVDWERGVMVYDMGGDADNVEIRIPNNRDWTPRKRTTITTTKRRAFGQRMPEYETSLSLRYEDSAPPPETYGSSLAGTAWTAVEVGSVVLNDDPPRPITLFFDEGGMYGSAGCNRYRTGIDTPSSGSFHTGAIATTRQYCRGVMEQERGYVEFMHTRTFFYEIINGGEELVLFDSAGPGEEPTQGVPVARFAKDDIGELV